MVLEEKEDEELSSKTAWIMSRRKAAKKAVSFLVRC